MGSPASKPTAYGEADKGAKAIIDFWWPENLWHTQKTRDEDFMVVMRKMQRDLLSYRERYMTMDDKVRAERTIVYLDALDRGDSESFW